MTDIRAVAVLNDLLAAENRSLAPRLFESTVFVSRFDIDAHRLVQRMNRAAREHAASLTSLILDLGGEPNPLRLDVSTADLHFLELHAVLPRLIDDQSRVVRAYSRAGASLAHAPRVAAVVARFLAEHQQSLDALRATPKAA